MRKAKAWAWTIAIIGIFIGFATGTYAIIFNLLPGSICNQLGAAEAGVVINIIIISIVMIFAIEIIILYYFYRPHVKAYFGKTTPR